MPERIVDNELNENENENIMEDKVLKYRICYPSFYGKKIVNAKYGYQYDWYPTTIDSLRLFKVINTTCYSDKKGYNLTRKEDVYNEPQFLYYDTPEQYASHNRVNITNKMVLDWHEKQQKIFPNGIFSREGYEKLKN